MTNGRFFAWYSYDQRHFGGLFVYAHLLPKVVFAQVVSVVTGEDDDGVVPLAGCLQCGENLADQGIDEADRCVVARSVPFCWFKSIW